MRRRACPTWSSRWQTFCAGRSRTVGCCWCAGGRKRESARKHESEQHIAAMRQGSAALAMARLAVLAVLVAGCAALDNGAGLTPPLGWSSWCTAGRCGNDYCDETIVKDVATAMQNNGMAKLGWNWLVLDDCWAHHRDPSTEELVWDSERFPSGIPALVNWLHERGFKFGLYTSAGNQTCSSGGRPIRVPGSEGHYVRDANTFAKWNLDYVKVDWCGDVKKDIFVGATDYRAFSHALNYSTPARPMFFTGVAAYLFLTSHVTEYVNGWRAWEDHHDQWSTTEATILAQEYIGTQGRPGAWPDLDVLTTGGQGCPHTTPSSSEHCPGQTDDEYRTEVAMWTMVQSPLMVATDLRNMTAIMRQLMLNPLLPQIHQNTATPPGRRISYWPCSGRPWDCQVWARPMNDSSVVVALLNLDSKHHDISVPLDIIHDVHWTPQTTVSTTDIFENAPGADATGTLKRTVQPHATAFLWLHKKSS
eukprot:m.146006 g.146006  ORF g.146006 m.146006 type:complete len:476 (-) comp10087_c0_seq6:23-1450(-)